MKEHDHHAAMGHIHPQENAGEYIKFAGIIAAILAASLWLASMRGFGLEQFLNDFMAVFFLVFAGFKLVNLEVFAITFSGYDIIAARFKAWGYIYPFMQLVLGVGYLVSYQTTTLNLLTIVISAVAGVGVLKELAKKSDIPCACLGTLIKLPLSKISFVEDFLMLGMAAVMLAL